jgi:tRNA threonylcarbamoyladenosine biosynthesis protein TsaB
MAQTPQKIIALETGGTRGSVAALNGPKGLLQRDLNPDQRSAQSLAPAVRQVLAEVGWRPADVQLVAITMGPGSFTGLRVGVTTAKTLAYVVGAHLIGVNTLEALAQQVPCQTERLDAVIDAGRQELYVGQFVPHDGFWQPTSGGRIESIASWLNGLPPRAMVTGPALAKFAARLPSHVTSAPASAWNLTALAVGQVAWRHYQAGRRDDPFQLTPLYLRRSAAEEKAAEKAEAAVDQSKKSGR